MRLTRRCGGGRIVVLAGVALIALIALIALPLAPAAGAASDGRTVVRLREVRALPRLGPIRSALTTDTFVVDGAAGDLAADPAVLWAAPDTRYRASREPNDPCWVFCPAALTGSQGLRTVGAPAAWDVTTGSSTIVVAVLDGAVPADHPDLAGKVRLGPDLVADECRGDDPTARSHGAAVAGLVAARTDNGQGVAALGWNTTVLAIRVLDDCGWGNASVVAAGIHHAIAAGARVINLSITGPPHPAVADALTLARRRGVVVVAAAGNGATTTPSYPAAHPTVIAVGATDPWGSSLAGFSNRGPWVDIAAPGVLVPSTSTLPGGYGMYEGTSFSTPMVAGAVALLLAVHPHFDPDDVVSALARSSRRTPSLAQHVRWGLLDAAELLTPRPGGAWIATSDGGVRTYGDAPFLGSAARLRLRAPVVGIAGVPGGYVLAAADGGVFTFGAARFAGSLAGRPLQGPIVGVAATPTGRGYWLLGADGGVFAFGDAPFAGSASGRVAGAGATAIAATPSGRGYAVVTAGGKVFPYGDARFAGAPPPLGSARAVAITMSGPSSYRIATDDGGLHAFGGAAVMGTATGRAPAPVVGMAETGDRGYWLLTGDGRPLAFGRAPDDGRILPPTRLAVGIAAAP